MMQQKHLCSVINSLIDSVYQVKLGLSGLATKRSAVDASSEKATRRDSYVPSINSHFASSPQFQTPQWTQLQL